MENALAKKRARVEDTESEVHDTQRATKVTRRAGELGESLGLRRSLRPTNNPFANRRGLELTTLEDGDSEMEEAEPDLIHESIRLADGFDEIDRMAPERVEPERAPPRKLRKQAEIAPINWMKDQSPFTIRDALTGSASQLQITLPQLLDCSPRLRRDLAELLRSSVPRSRKKRLSSGKAQAEPITLHSAKKQVGRNILSEANPEIQENMECLYIEAWVGKNKLPEVLVDAGAMLDLISTQLIDKLGFERFPVSGLGMRLADDRLVVLRNYVWLDVVVAGVLARIKAYEVAVSQTYHLLLSRRWLKRVKAVEYHDFQMLFIEGSDRVRRKVPAIPNGATGVKMENIEPESFFEVDDDEAEDGVETLLNELDDWEEGELHAMSSEN